MKVSIIPWLVWAVAFFVVQSGTLYLLLRVLEYRFFVSAIVATTLSVVLAHFARRFIERSYAA